METRVSAQRERDVNIFNYISHSHTHTKPKYGIRTPSQGRDAPLPYYKQLKVPSNHTASCIIYIYVRNHKKTILWVDE